MYNLSILNGGRQRELNDEFKGNRNNRLYLNTLFCRDLCYYLIRNRCYFREKRAMPLKTSMYVPKLTAASRGTPRDSTAFLFYIATFHSLLVLFCTTLLFVHCSNSSIWCQLHVRVAST